VAEFEIRSVSVSLESRVIKKFAFPAQDLLSSPSHAEALSF